MPLWLGQLIAYGKVALLALAIMAGIGLLCRVIERRWTDPYYARALRQADQGDAPVGSRSVPADRRHA